MGKHSRRQIKLVEFLEEGEDYVRAAFEWQPTGESGIAPVRCGRGGSSPMAGDHLRTYNGSLKLFLKKETCP